MVAARLGLEAEPPEIDGVTALYLEAFYSLTRSRQGTGYGALPIQISEVKAWRELMRSPLDPESLLYIIQRLDKVHLDHLNRKQD